MTEVCYRTFVKLWKESVTEKKNVRSTPQNLEKGHEPFKTIITLQWSNAATTAVVTNTQDQRNSNT